PPSVPLFPYTTLFRSIRIGVEERAVVLDLEGLHPLRIPVRQWRPKACRAELTDEGVHPGRPAQEFALRCEVSAVVLETVDPDLEPASPKVLHQVPVNAVSIGDEVEG